MSHLIDEESLLNLLKRFYHSFFTVCCIVLFGMILTCAITWKSAEWISQNEQDRFDSSSQQMLLLIQSALQKNVQVLQSLVAFLMTSDDVNRDEWKQFIEYHRFDESLNGVQIFGYAPRIKKSDTAWYEEFMRNNGHPSFHIFPSSEQLYVFPMVFIEPLDALNQKALGFDVNSEARRREALDTAIRTGKATFSSKIELIMHKKTDNDKDGYVIYLPVYHSFMPTNTELERVQASKGVVILALQTKDFFMNLLGMKYIGVDFELYEGHTVDTAMKVYDSNPSLQNARLQKTICIWLYGKEWCFAFKANTILDIGLSRFVPIIEFLGGIVLSLLLGGLLLSLQRTRHEALRLAEKMTQKLAHSEAEIHSIFQAMNEGIIVMNRQGEVIQCNKAAQSILQLGTNDILGKTAAHTQWQAIREDGSVFTYEERPSVKAFNTKHEQHNVIMGIKRHDDSMLWAQVNAEPILDKTDMEIQSIVVTISDITLYRQSKYKLERYINIIDHYVIVSTTDCTGKILDVSSAFCRISGYSKEELLGKNHNIVRHPDMPSSLYRTMWEQLENNESWEGEMKNRHKSGSAYWVKAVIAPLYDELGVKIGYTAIREDITDKKRIEELSITDRLTGLYNRHKLDELFESFLHAQERYGHDFSIALLDIDHFKSINDTYGHQVGDNVLQELATCLRTNLRQEDIAARWGGEEFIILIPSVDLLGACALAEKLRSVIERQTFEIVGHVTVSFGVTSYGSEDTQKQMVSRADRALYKAKEKGRNRVETFAL